MNTKLSLSCVTAGAFLAVLILGCDAPGPTVPTPSTSGGSNAEAHVAVKLTSANFGKTVRENESVVLVDFWATWCGPCLQLAPTVEAVAVKYEGRAIVAKLDIDEEERLAGEYGIRSIPTLIVFKNGKVVDRMVGVVPQSRIEKALDAQLD